MSNKLIETAAAQARTKWLQKLLFSSLPELNNSNADYHNWFDNLMSVMEDRGLVKPTQQKDYLSDVRNAIKVINPDHPALEVVDFDKATWTNINNRSSDRLAERTTKFIDNPDAIVQRATVLLGSYQWSEIAAGLAVVTGRRSTEVIKTAQFEYKTRYSVIFTGALKRKNEPVECVFEIPTLCEANLVTNAIANLRHQLGEEIHSLSKRQVSSRYGKAVATKCDRYFTELVPKREDKDNLYTHLFRAVYATIAAYWYCPPTVPEMEFRAAIQGHYQILDELNPELRRSLAAGRNYFDYKISDGQGNIDGRLGIKLELPDVKVIGQFQQLDCLRQSDDLRSANRSSDWSRRGNLADPLVQSAYTPLQKESLTSSPSSLPTTNNQTTTNRQSQSTMSETSRKSNGLDDSSTPASSNSTSSSNSAVTIPSFFLSRLDAISNRLQLSQAESIQALFTWTEMGLSLAERLEINELNPQAVFESVEELKQISVDASSQFPSNPNLPMSIQQSTQPDVLLDRQQALFKLCNSVELLSHAMSSTSFAIAKINSDSVEPHTARKNTSPLIKQSSARSTELDKAKVKVENQKPSQSPAKDRQNTKTTNKSSSSKSSKGKRRSQRTIESEREINLAIDTVMEFNNAEGRTHKDKWYIGIGSIRTLTGRGDKVIRRVIEQREDVTEHHHLHQLDQSHNIKGRDATPINEVITLPSSNEQNQE